MKMKDFSCEELKALAVELPDEVNRYKMAGDFEGIVQDVNTRGVPPQDVLSWGPYYYDKESDEILKLNNITLNKLFA